MARSLSETPDPTEIFEVHNSADDPQQRWILLAAAFPTARMDYVVRLFEERLASLEKETEWQRYQMARIRAVQEFLKRNGYVNMAEGGRDLKLQPQELWNKIMREADLPLSEMPEYIQVK